MMGTLGFNLGRIKTHGNFARGADPSHEPLEATPRPRKGASTLTGSYESRHRVGTLNP